jgi:alcohol dehydrogenase class IV
VSITPAPFRWQDGERLVLFGRGRLTETEALLEPGYVVLTTGRAASSARAIVDRASAVHEVGAGRVDELAAALRGQVEGELLVALGGGRVIDVAKALAAADPPRRVAAIPTTLSGAEMTPIHRHAAGVAVETPRVRPAIVVNDPSLSASQPLRELACSAGNALGHAVEGPLTPLGNPLASIAARQASALIGDGFSGAEPGRDALALGSLLAGYVIGSTIYGLHHVLSQTLVRFAGVGHGAANTLMLPHSITALERRFPSLAEGFDPAPAILAERLRELAGLTGLRDLGVTEAELDRCAEQAAARPELRMTPPPADRNELRALYRAAS